MNKLHILKIVLLLSFTSLLAYDADNGHELYNEAKCSECHENSHFTDKNRKAKNYKELSNSVEACRYGTNADWFDEDRDDVIHYLNKEFYKYKVKK